MPNIPEGTSAQILDISGSWARHIESTDSVEFDPFTIDIGEEAVGMARERGLSRKHFGLSGAIALLNVGYHLESDALRDAGVMQDYQLLIDQMARVDIVSVEAPEFFSQRAQRDRN